jgi:hypothetical protein
VAAVKNSGLSEGIIIDNGVVKGFHIPEDEAWRLVPEFARDRDFPFFRTTVDFVLAQVKEYAKIKKENESDQDKKDAWNKIVYDISESELLSRLLEGKPMFTYPPPKSFKSHWYDLLEMGEGIPMVVKFSKFGNGTGLPGKPDDGDKFAIIDEFTWEIKERLDKDSEFLVQYHTKAPVFLLRKATNDERARLLHPRQVRMNKSTEEEWILIQEGK